LQTEEKTERKKEKEDKKKGKDEPIEGEFKEGNNKDKGK